MKCLVCGPDCARDAHVCPTCGDASFDAPATDNDSAESSAEDPAQAAPATTKPAKRGR